MSKSRVAPQSVLMDVGPGWPLIVGLVGLMTWSSSGWTWSWFTPAAPRGRIPAGPTSKARMSLKLRTKEGKAAIEWTFHLAGDNFRKLAGSGWTATQTASTTAPTPPPNQPLQTPGS